MRPEAVKRRIGIVHFAATRQDCADCIKRVEHGRVVLSQELVGEADNKRQSKLQDLCCAGRLDNWIHLLVALGNFKMFST